MKLTAITNTAVCSYCKKRFEKGFEIDFDRMFVSSPKICENCAKEFFMVLGQKIVPKSPKNINFGYKVFKDKDFE